MTETTTQQPTTEQDTSDSPANFNGTSAEQEKRQRRLPKGTMPPALNLEEAIDIARKIHEMPGGVAPYSAAMHITGNSATSSVFGKKMMALRDFGIAVADDKKKAVSLTELGQKVVAPRDEDEHLKSLGQSFLSIGIFAKAYDKIKGRPLPHDQYMINTFCEWVPKELTAGWLEKLKRSIKTAYLLDESRPDGKVYVLDKPQLIQAAKPSEEEPQMKDERTSRSENSSMGSEAIRTPIPLGLGRLAYIELPPDWDRRELKKLLAVLKLALGDDEEAPS
ncbi:MAG: hypothetical protein ACREA2_15755 [Blastocatellia bacterium]